MIRGLNKSYHPRRTLSARGWFGLVALISILIRVGLWLAYQPVAFGDTPSYRRSAEAVLGGFENYDGTRTPGYPVFLAILGPDDRVWIVQMFLGVGISLLLFYIAWNLTGQPVFAAIAGLAHSLNLGQLFFEANLLTETLATFWVVLTLSGVLLWLLQPEKRSIWLAAGLGFTSSLALMTRPLFIFLPVWILIFLGFEHWSFRMMWRYFFFIIPVILIVGGWISFIHERFGDWSLTTMTGYHLVQHTGSFFEYVPEKYAELRDIYLEYRQNRISEFGTQANTIWDAIPAMQAATGLNFYDLSRTLADISIQLILEHPLLYVKNVVEGWIWFWLAPVYWSPEAVNVTFLRSIIQFVIVIQRILLVIVNIIFVFSSILTFIFQKRISMPTNKRLFIWCWLGTIWIASILQTLLDHGDNPRFSIPLQSLIVLWVMWVTWKLLQEQSLLGNKITRAGILIRSPEKSSTG